MADIVNGGAIVLMAALGLVAIIGGADQLREMAGPAPSIGSEAASAGSDEGRPDLVDRGSLSPVDLGVDDDGDREGGDRDGKRGDGDRGRDRDDRGHQADDDDTEDDEEDEDEEDDD